MKTPTRSSTRIKLQAADIKSPRSRETVVAKDQTTTNKARKKTTTCAPKTTANKAKKTTTKKGTSRNPQTYQGKPQATLPNGKKWPAGWIEKHFARQSGRTALDRYWYPPKTNYKLRSLKEVLRYLQEFQTSKNAQQAMQAVTAAKLAPTSSIGSRKNKPKVTKKTSSPAKTNATSAKRKSTSPKKRHPEKAVAETWGKPQEV